MKCNAAAYEGTEPYIFVSYCHQDQARVYPYIEMFAADGYRVWYDEGITPGEEWTENIARHLEGCSVFIAFITESSLNSHNCRREINFAIQRNKNFVSLFLDDARLSAGMEMLLSSVQGIYRSHYPASGEFVRKLYSTAALDQCRGEERAQIRETDRYLDEDETVTLTQSIAGFEAGELETYLLRVANQEKIQIRRSAFTIGRSRSHSDYVITGESSISRRHATIRKIRDSYMIVDNKSLNHVGINGRLIMPEVEYELTEFDVVSLAKEHMVFFRDYNEAGLRLMPGYVLQGEDCVYDVPALPVVRIGSRPLDNDGFGNEICVRDSSILPSHAFLISSPEGLWAVDLSGSRSTAVGGRPLLFCEKILLKPGDILTMGGCSLEVARRI